MQSRRPGGLSLHRQLLLFLLLPQLVLWLAGGVAAYKLAEGYTNRAIDASLLQASRALARQLKPLGNGLMIDFPRAAQDVLEADPDDRLYYMVSTPPGQFILGNHAMPPPPAREPARPDQPYFYDGMMAGSATAGGSGQRVRVAALYLTYGEAGRPDQTMLVQVARSRTSREELARSILVSMLLPLSSLVLLMTVIVWAGIRAGLAPLARLRREVEGREPTDLAPIQLESAPRELHALAHALNELLAAVRRNVATQKRFISDAAHQLRTPLAGLKSQTELALQACPDPGLRPRLLRVHESATRSAHLVKQLLTLARAEPESTLALNHSVFDLRRLAQELTAEMVPRALRAGMDLGLDSPSDTQASGPVLVRGNALLLSEALGNLIDNAICYAGTGAVITVALRREAGEAVLEVMDDGPGIAAAHLPRVFERFMRATDAGNGCGLGLAIVKEIVERHAGRVALTPETPHGLRACIWLPLSDGTGDQGSGAPTLSGSPMDR